MPDAAARAVYVQQTQVLPGRGRFKGDIPLRATRRADAILRAFEVDIFARERKSRPRHAPQMPPPSRAARASLSSASFDAAHSARAKIAPHPSSAPTRRNGLPLLRLTRYPAPADRIAILRSRSG
jgi:hypothetical protein